MLRNLINSFLPHRGRSRLNIAWPLAFFVFVGTLKAEFTDVTEQAGVDFLHGTLATPIPSSPLYYAGGLAVTDLNHDGWLDLFVTRLSGGNLMFINNGDGTFNDEAGVRGLTGPIHSNGAAFVDIDNDGDADLLLTAIDSPRYYAYLNQGDGTFVEQAELRAIATPDTA
ncbi:MAG: VCBS repeat-containing protein [Opitutaceae bacterium]|jgi:enediyne biosynthesis protein E4|nr:VCBS repeat-containing protein [Opitutaceae bacterium]